MRLTHDIDLQQFNIQRPDRVRWTATIEQDDVLNSLRSKSLRKFLKNIDEVLHTHNISWTLNPLTKDEYSQWFRFYTEKMSHLQYDVLATPEWYDQKLAEGKTVEGLIFTQADILVGAGIVARTEMRKASLAFKASEKIDMSNISNGNLGAIIDYFFIREMHRMGVKEISGGRSYNAFGSLTNFGYLEYKTKFYTPAPATNFSSMMTVPVNEEGDALFYGFDINNPDVLTLYHIKKAGFERSNFTPQMFTTTNIPYQTIEYLT